MATNDSSLTGYGYGKSNINGAKYRHDYVLDRQN